VQCKKWVSRAPEPADLYDTIAWAKAHKPNVLIIMVSNTLSGNTKDWIAKIEEDVPYSIVYFEEINFKGFFDKNREIYVKFFEKKQSKLDEYYVADIQQRLIVALAKKGSITANGISEEASISINKVKKNLKLLNADNLVNIEKRKFYLINTQATFLKVSEKLLESKSRFEFVGSQYANLFINQELINHIESRYFLSLNPENRYSILLMIKISPNALQHALFGNTEAFKNGYEHLKTLKLKEADEKKWAESFPHQFILDLLRKLIIDLANPDSTELLVKETIEGYFLKIDLKMANVSKPLLKVTSGSGVMLQKAQGKIDAGQLLTVTNPDVYLRTADILSNLDLNEQAIEHYNLAIAKLEDNEKLKVAYNNKGVTLRKMDKNSEAISCFDEALKIDPNLREALKNRDECLSRLKG